MNGKRSDIQQQIPIISKTTEFIPYRIANIARKFRIRVAAIYVMYKLVILSVNGKESWKSWKRSRVHERIWIILANT